MPQTPREPAPDWPVWGETPVPDEEFVAGLRAAEAAGRARELLDQAGLRVAAATHERDLARADAADLAARLHTVSLERDALTSRLAELLPHFQDVSAAYARLLPEHDELGARHRALATRAEELAAELAAVKGSRTWRARDAAVAVKHRLVP